MNLQEILQKRRSIRKFADQKVEQELVDKLLEATLTAPSSRNSRSTHLIVISCAEKIERIASMRDYGSAFVAGAPLFILVAGDKTATDLWQVNCSISATILQLAATDLGLASCWVHVEGRAHRKDEPEGINAEEYLRTIVDLPEEFGVLCGVAVGHSDFQPAPLPSFDAASHVREIK